VNCTVAAVDAFTVGVTPVAAGAYTVVRYAANTFPQCAVYSLSNGVPAPPFQLSLAGAASLAPAAALSAARSRPVGDGASTRRGTPGGAVASPWREWKGRVLLTPAPGSLPPPMGFNR